MRVLFAWDGDYPWDVRVEKICDSLIRAGHAIHLVCRNTRDEPLEEIHQGIHLHRLAYRRRLPERLNRALTVPFFFNPAWIARLVQVQRRTRCDAVFVRDLPLAPAAVALAKAWRLPCIYDMAECYPEMYKSVFQIDPFRVRDLLLRNPMIAEALERLTVRLADKVLVMVDESRDRLLARGVPPHKLELVSNTPNLERYHDLPAPAPTAPLTVIYQGLLNPARGIDTVIDAAAIHVARDPEFRLVLVGTDRAEAALRARVQRHGLEQVVEFRGWIDNRDLPAAIAAAHVGIVPHYRTAHTDHTVPNKLFDYMAAGKPVVVSNARPLARIVTESGAGIVYPDRDPVMLALAFARLKDEVLRRYMGENGRRAVAAGYNWAADERRLLAAVGQLQAAAARDAQRSAAT